MWSDRKAQSYQSTCLTLTGQSKKPNEKQQLHRAKACTHIHKAAHSNELHNPNTYWTSYMVWISDRFCKPQIKNKKSTKTIKQGWCNPWEQQCTWEWAFSFSKRDMSSRHGCVHHKFWSKAPQHSHHTMKLHCQSLDMVSWNVLIAYGMYMATSTKGNRTSPCVVSITRCWTVCIQSH